ncbi:MAG: tetratricopeptide repeat protein [Thermoguttaceae bacterium]|nr:tetratricopeptide repeat protein [Thermoguttaceae bacterium]
MTSNKTKEERYDEAIAFREAGDLKSAVSVLEQLAADFPDYALAHLGLAVFYWKQERPDDSIREASRACELSPDEPFYFTALSSLAIKAGHRKTAEEALARAQEARFQAFMQKYREEYPESDTSEKSEESGEAQ